MRVVFMGSPAYAVPSLRAVCAAGHEVAAVVTQPPRPAGRGRQLRPTPIAEAAADLHLTTFTPRRVNHTTLLNQVRPVKPDVILVIAYGELLREKLLQMPPHGCINAHGSLLPRWRGAAPISAAIAAGDEVTGVTLMRMVRRLDAGPMLHKREVAIDPRETAGTLHDKLADVSAECFVRYLDQLQQGEAPEGQVQDEAQALYAPKLRKEDGRIDWTRSADEVDRLVRAMDPWPSAYTILPEGKMLKVLTACPRLYQCDDAAPGTIVAIEHEGPVVACGDGCVRLECVQPEGKRKMTGTAFLAGHRLEPGSALAVLAGKT